jgi:hypothetical protein
VTVDEALDFLKQQKKSMRCSELERVLAAFGFVVNDCKKAGHKKIKHSSLDGFIGSSFDGAHGSDSQIKPCYVGTVIKLITTYRTELEKLMETAR